MSETDAETLLQQDMSTPCPNPRCGALVRLDQKSCTLCGNKLEPCPSCAKLMSVTIGRCGRCGHRIATASSEERAEKKTDTAQTDQHGSRGSVLVGPAVFHFSKPQEEVRRAVAEAYRNAALRDAEMVRATLILKRARTWLQTEPDALQTWRLLDGEIAAADPASLRSALVSLRDWFTTELFAYEIQLLREAFERDAATGWRQWLRKFAEALAHWRVALCRALVEADLPFPEQFRVPHDFRRVMRLVLHQRWPEAHTLWKVLAQNESLHPWTRARLLITAGEIWLYYFTPRETALRSFAQAQQLAPDLGQVLAALGNYYVEEGSVDKARKFFLDAIELAPDRFHGYCSMGDLALKESRLSDAESWFLKAIANSGADSNGYTRLLALYGQPSWIEEHEESIEPLAESAKAVEPTEEYQIYLNVGDAYKSAQRFEQAHAWYDKAIALQPDCLAGYISKGFAYIEEGDHRYEEARTALMKAIDVAPESYNGYWGMGQLFERQENWADAAGQYALAAERQPEMQPSMQVRIGEMQWKLGKQSEAESTLLGALELDPSADSVVLDVVDDYLVKLDRPADARRLLESIRKIKGESYEASYRNRLGNIYYHQEDYESAASQYIRAIELDPKKPIFVTNLSGTYRLMKRWEEARQQLRKVLELDGNQQAFNRGMALIYNDEGNDYLDRQDYESAASQYLRAIELDPKEPIFFSNLAGAYKLTKRWEEARQQLRKVFELDGNQQAFDRGTALIYNDEGNDYLDRQDYESAASQYLRAIELDPKEPIFVTNLSGAYRLMKRWDEARQHLRKVLELDGNQQAFDRGTALIYNDEGNDYLAREDYASAASQYLRAIELDPKEPIFFSNLASAYRLMKRWDEAHQQLHKAFELDGNQQALDSGTAFIYNAEGNDYLDRQDYESAASQYLRAIELDPKEPIFVTNLSGAYRLMKRWDEAHQQLHKAFELDGNQQAFDRGTAFIYNAEGNDYLDRQDYESAASQYLRAIELDPKEPIFVSNLASAYRLMKRWDEAHQQLHKAFELDGNQQAFDRGTAFIYNAEGNDYLDRQDYESAASQYLRAIELDPKEPIFVTNLSGAYRLMKRWDEAHQQLHKVFELDANQQAFDRGTAFIYNAEGNDYLDRQDYESAASQYLRAIELDPKEPIFVSNLAGAYALMKRWDEARQQLHKVFELDANQQAFDSGMALIYNAEGNDYLARQDYESAASQYLRAIDLDPKKPIFFSNLAGAYALTKRWEEARQQLHKVFELDANQQAFDSGTALIYNAEGNDYLARQDYESAASQYLRATDLDPKDPIFVTNLAGTYRLMKRWTRHANNCARFSNWTGTSRPSTAGWLLSITMKATTISIARTTSRLPANISAQSSSIRRSPSLLSIWRALTD